MDKSSIILGVGGALFATGGAAVTAFAPQLFPEAGPTGFWGGAAVTLFGAAMLLYPIFGRTKGANSMPEDKSIKVQMGHGNTIGHIGHVNQAPPPTFEIVAHQVTREGKRFAHMVKIARTSPYSVGRIKLWTVDPNVLGFSLSAESGSTIMGASVINGVIEIDDTRPVLLRIESVTDRVPDVKIRLA